MKSMMTIKKTLCVLLLAMPALAVAAPGPGCESVNLGADVLAKFPNATRACRDVKMKGDGIYMHYVAEVVATDKDTVTANLLDTSGKAITRVKFAPAADQTAKLEGKDEKYTSLKKGTKLDFYIEHSQWGLFGSPGGKRMTIISREDL
jgi:hypothetical protein